MRNKKKQPAQAAINYSTAIASGSNDFEIGESEIGVEKENNEQPNDSIEIKQESDIKPEPVDSSDLVDIPASTYRNASHFVGPSESPSPHYLNGSILFDVKDEMKEECDNEKEKGPKKDENPNPKANSSNEAVDQQLPLQDEDDLLQPASGNHTNDTQKRGSSAHKNISIKHKCEFCEYSAQYKCHLNQHMLKHTGEKPHACDYCPKRFTSKQNLHSHMKAHVAESLFHCAICLQVFDGKVEKSTHEAICNILRYECYICKESFGSMNANMIDHMRVHSGDRSFECNECSKKFTQKGALNEHKKIHDGQRVFRCSRCQQGFSEEGKRNSHEGQCRRKVHEFEVCGKSFGLYKSHLIQHMRTHTGERPFQCKQCPKKFTLKSHLTSHMKAHTKSKLPFNCLICRKGFAMDDKRKAHQRNCNGRKYECYLCNRVFGSKKMRLEFHIRIHLTENPVRR